MSLIRIPKTLNIKEIRTAFQQIATELGPKSESTHNGLTLSGLTANRLVRTDSEMALSSVLDLTEWVAGTANEIDVTDNGDGTVTIGIVDPLIVSKGGTGLATLTDHSLLVGSGTDAITPLGVATNGQIPIGSTGADPVLAALTGTANQIIVTNGAGSITLSTPQDIHTGASPQFAGLSIYGNVVFYGGNRVISIDGIYNLILKTNADDGFHPSGDLTLQSGDGSYRTGDVNITTGYNNSSGVSGSINLTIGNSYYGAKGKIYLDGDVDINGDDLTAEFTHLAGLDQSLATTDSPTFAGVISGGTIQAEQLTSTDDITMAGLLTNTLAADDAIGLLIDGDTNPKTYAGLSDNVYKMCRTLNGSGSTAYPSLGVGFRRIFTFDYDYTGLNTGLNNKNLYAGGEFFVLSGDINISGGSGNRTLSVGDTYNITQITGDLTNSSAASLTLKSYGAYFSNSLASDVNYTGAGTLTAHLYGGYFYSSTSEFFVTAGTANTYFYGGAFIAIGTGLGDTSVSYGGYFSGTGSDTNWGIYVAAGESYLGIDSAKSYWGTGSDLQVWHDGTNSYIYNDTGLLKIQDAGNGINLGTATSELLGFYGVTPVDQPATVADASDLATCITSINAVIDRLQELGLIA